MTERTRQDDWTRSPARPLAALVLMMLLLSGLAIGWSEGRAPAGQLPVARQALPARLIDVNHATAAELDLLPGIGPKKAAGIIQERTEGGPFRDLDDLERVRGIGPRTVQKLRPLATASSAD